MKVKTLISLFCFTLALVASEESRKHHKGFKINSVKDDAAGLETSSRLNVLIRNLNDAISMAQIAEGALNEITNILQRMRALSQQAANGSNVEAERLAIQEEATALKDELNHIAETTSFGDRRLLDGTFGTQSFQIGADNGEALQLTLTDMRPSNAMMGVDTIDLTSLAGSRESVASIDAALIYVDVHLADLTAFENRCQHAIVNLENSNEKQQRERMD